VYWLNEVRSPRPLFEEISNSMIAPTYEPSTFQQRYLQATKPCDNSLPLTSILSQNWKRSFHLGDADIEAVGVEGGRPWRVQVILSAIIHVSENF
jgi:hypothetical protein